MLNLPLYYGIIVSDQQVLRLNLFFHNAHLLYYMVLAGYEFV